MKKLLFFVGVVVLSAATFADVTYTGADETAPLDLSLETNWSAAPTADDVATVSMSVAPGTTFTLSGDLSVEGATFAVVDGDDATMRVEYDAKLGCLVLRRQVGNFVIIR